MKAVIFAHKNFEAMSMLAKNIPTSMFPLVDRPFIHHVLDHLVQQGFRDIHIVLSEQPEIIEEYVGYGIRWGISVHYHLIRNPNKPYEILRTINSGSDSSTPSHVLIAHGERIPVTDSYAFSTTASLPIYVCDKGAGHSWTGWAWIATSDIENMPPSPEYAEMEAYMLAGDASRITPVSDVISIVNPVSYLAAQNAVLADTVPGMLKTGREVSPGVRVSRNVSIAPDATLTAPVYIGPNTRIGKGASIGPNVTIGDGCIVGKGSTIQQAAVTSGTYVGEGLEIDRGIARHDVLASVTIDAQVSIMEPFILCAVRPLSSKHSISRMTGRIMAALILMVTAPLFLIKYMARPWKKNNSIVARRFICPAVGDGRDVEIVVDSMWSSPPVDRSLWHHMWNMVLPRLPHVVRGHMDLVGLPPRSVEELNRMPADWRELYESSRVGAISEALVHFGPVVSEDDCRAADAYYAAVTDWRHDVQIVVNYVLGLFRNVHSQNREIEHIEVHV